MSCVSGTNIVSDGLVFHFDLENGVKSWKGKPTSNQYTNTSISGLGGWIFGSWNSNYYKEDVLVEGPFGKNVNAIKITRNTPSAGSSHFHQGNNGKYIVGNWYTLSCWVKGAPGSQFRGIKHSEYDYDADYINFITLDGTWQYYEYSVYLREETTTKYPYWDATYIDDGTDLYFCYPQSELGTFPTKYVNGTRLDTASIIDISGNNHVITANNLTYRQDDTPTFDGTDDTLYAGNTLNFGTNDLTLESWFKKSSDQDGWRSIFQKGTSGRAGYGMHIYNNRLSASIQATSNQHNTHFDALLTNVWYNCLIVFDRDAGIFSYINGELVGNYVYAPGNDGSIDTTSQIQIGGYNSEWNFHGEISQVKIYDKALTSAEVKQNFEATRSRYGI